MMLTNLDIYYSAACNLKCEYCCMPHASMTNEDIIKTLKDGSFAKKVIDVIQPETTSLSFCGMEPTINQQYFKYFLIPILDKHPQIKYITLFTNLTNDIMQDIIIPLHFYTKYHFRNLILKVQVGLDGPDYILDKHAGLKGYYWLLDRNLEMIARSVSKYENKYFQVQVYNKSTLTAKDLHTDPTVWWYWMAYVQSKFEDYESDTFMIKMDNPPTIAIPGNYTKADGIALCKWELKFNTNKFVKCLANMESKIIDCNGNIHNCYLSCNKDIDEQSVYNDFNIKVDRLLAEGEIIETNKQALWNAISSIYCWATSDGTIPESYIKLLGNGALQEA